MGEEAVAPSTEGKAVIKSEAPQQKKQSRRRLNEIYQLPLPLTCHPLPTFIPHNPLSLLRVAYAVITGLLWPPSSHPNVLYKGYFSTVTQSVHVTDKDTIRALWEKGFFGKGSLSRSDPSWLEREKTRRGLVITETSEDHTRARRNERRQMKYERALKEREAIEEQLRQEGKKGDFLSYTNAGGPLHTVAGADSTESSLLPADTPASALEDSLAASDTPVTVPTASLNGLTDQDGLHALANGTFEPEDIDLDEDELVLENQEHLQLSLEESLFLVYGLGILEIFEEKSPKRLTTSRLLDLCRIHSDSPPISEADPRPDDTFFLKYVVYHHFRSLGWVVRHGNKFSVDFLLYNRGPVFSHAEFAVIILPSYSHPYWTATEERAQETERKQSRDWWWFHCVNRVQAHVRKTLVTVYVDVPPPFDPDLLRSDNVDIGRLLKQYKVREFVLRRWLMNRSRD